MLSLEEAKLTERCRICESKIEILGAPIEWKDQFDKIKFPEEIIINFGMEFAHKRCLKVLEKLNQNLIEEASLKLRELYKSLIELNKISPAESKKYPQYFDGLIEGITVFIAKSKLN